MIWELMRHEWANLGAAMSASDVPHAVELLLKCSNQQDAEKAGELINNNVVVQGALYEAAPPAAACLVVALASAPSVARLTILELLNNLCGGNVSPDEEAAGYPLQRQCLDEVRKGAAIYLHLLQHGTLAERRQCVDLLDMCAQSDSSLVEQVAWYFAKVRELHLCSDLDTLIDNTLNQ